jgi:hypothetical protein
MPAPQNIVAVIFDFEDTLTDESTTKLLEHYGIDAVEFWQKQNPANHRESVVFNSILFRPDVKLS